MGTDGLINEEAEEPGAWAAAVARCWASEWDDPREDIYGLEERESVQEDRQPREKSH